MADASNDGPLMAEAVASSSFKTVVTQVLGRIDAPAAQVLGKPAGNSTRWILDVECVPGTDVELYLLDFNSGRRISPDLKSFTLTALNAAFYDAKPFVVDKPGCLILRTRDSANSSTVCLRMQIDVMHSATR